MNKSGKGRDAVNRFIDAVKKGNVPDGDDLRHIATALDEILNHSASPKDALGINQGRGRPPARTALKKLSAIYEVRYLRRQKNMKLERARDVVADMYSISSGTLKNWIEDQKWKAIADECEGVLAAHAALFIGMKVMDGNAPAREFWERYDILDQEYKDIPGMSAICAGARFWQWYEENPGESHYPVPGCDEAILGPVIREKDS